MTRVNERVQRCVAHHKHSADFLLRGINPAAVNFVHRIHKCFIPPLSFAAVQVCTNAKRRSALERVARIIV
jgi:hypothetical protein